MWPQKKALQNGSIRLSGVSKSFNRKALKSNSYDTLKSRFLSLFSLSSCKSDTRAGELGTWVHYALSDISLDVSPGSSLGVIGRNGSGKSTLLKLVSGIYRPDAGEVAVKGRISALIELGAGFHPDFTGRENVYLGGVMYGLSKREIDRRFDDIVSYAELESFIDDPVRTYSSGMFMRLGFSLAVHTEPDILLVDEVLSVGDAAFVRRCQDTISQFKKEGRTLLFVTHDLESVARWCDHAIWLNDGHIVQRGEPRWVIDSYLQELENKEEEELEHVNHSNVCGDTAKNERVELGAGEGANPTTDSEANRWGNGYVELTDVRMVSQSGEISWVFHGGDYVEIVVSFEILRKIEEMVFGIGIFRADGLCVCGLNTDIDKVQVPIPDYEQFGFGDLKCGETLPKTICGSWRFVIESIDLVEGSYFLDLAAHQADGVPYDYRYHQFKFSVHNQSSAHGVCIPEHSWDIVPNYLLASGDDSAFRVEKDGKRQAL